MNEGRAFHAIAEWLDGLIHAVCSWSDQLEQHLPQRYRELSAAVKRRIRLGLLWLLAILFVLNPMGGSLMTSVRNQEFFSFHLNDVAGALTGRNGGSNTEDYYLSTGTYEDQIDGPLLGAAKDKNLIVIQVEALQNIMIDAEYNGQELTPNLNRLIKEQGSVYFDHYYQMLGSGNTSDSEFVTNNSIMGSIESYTYQLFEDNYFKGLPWLLQEQGYSTAVFHGYDKSFWNRENIYPKLGFQEFVNSDILENDNRVGLDDGNLRGISDEAFFQQSMEYLKEMKKPFYSFFITLSSHHPFQLPEDMSEIQLSKSDEGTLFGYYLNAVHYADKSLGMFLDNLKAEGLYDESLICIYGDHFGLPETDDEVQKRVSEFLGTDYKLNHMMNIPLIMHIPGADVNQTISMTAGQVDFLPTVSYLLGMPTLDTLYFGQNLLTAKEGFVWEQTHLLKGSFITDDIVFEMARDGVVSHSKAWKRDTGEEVDSTQYEELSMKAKMLTEMSNFYLKNDVLEKALKQRMTMEEILSGSKVEEPAPDTIYSVTAEDLKRDDWDDLETTLGDDLILVAVPTVNQEGEEGKVYIGELVRFMEQYDHIKIMLDLPHDPVEILREMKQVDLDDTHEAAAMRANLMSRAIPVIHNFDTYTRTEYEGFDNIVVVPDLGAYTIADMQGFLNQNQPFAMLIPVSEAEDETFVYLLERKDIFTYGYGASEEQREKWIKAGFHGLMSTLPQP